MNSCQIDKFLVLTDNLRHQSFVPKLSRSLRTLFLHQTVEFPFNFCIFSWNLYDCSHGPTVA